MPSRNAHPLNRELDEQLGDPVLSRRVRKALAKAGLALRPVGEHERLLSGYEEVVKANYRLIASTQKLLDHTKQLKAQLLLARRGSP